ncbi:MAG: hypothetical protein WCK02_10115 [Bacteroidota bacterium]
MKKYFFKSLTFIVFVCLFVSSSTFASTQADSKVLIKEREAEKDKYLDSKSRLMSDSSKSNLRIIIENAEVLLAKDQEIISDYKIVSDSLQNVSQKLGELNIKTNEFENELSKKSTWMIIFMITTLVGFVLMIVFLLLLNSKSSKLKKISVDILQLNDRENIFNERVNELQKEIEKIRLESENRISENEKKNRAEVNALKDSETELKRINSLLEKQLNTIKQNENDFIAKESELKERIEKEIQLRINIEEQLAVSNQKSENNKTNEDNEVLIRQNEILKNEINTLLDRLTREAQVKEQLETQLNELKNLIEENIITKEHVELNEHNLIIEKANIEKEQLLSQIFELKQQIEENKKALENNIKAETSTVDVDLIIQEKNQIEKEKNDLLQTIAVQSEKLEDETIARKLLEQEFYKILEELKLR